MQSNRQSALQRAAACVVEQMESRVLMSAAPALRPETLLPGDTTPGPSLGSQINTSFAEGPNGVSLAVWEDTRSGGNGRNGTFNDIYASRIAADGTVLDTTPIAIAANDFHQSAPEAAWNGANWLVAWQSDRPLDEFETDIHAVRVAPDGAVLDQQPRIIGTHLEDPNSSDDIDPEGPLQVLSNGSDWFVTWKRHNPSIAGGIGVEYFATRVTADGAVPNPEGTNYFTTDQNTPDYGLSFSPANGGQFLDAYFIRDVGAGIRRFDANFNVIAGSNRTLPNGGGQDLSFGASPTGWVLAWEQLQSNSNTRVQAVRVDGASGNFIDTTPLNVTPSSAGVDFSLDAKWDGADYVVAYSNYSAATAIDHDIYARRLSTVATGTAAMTDAFKVLGGPQHQASPRIAGSANGGFKFLFTDTSAAKPGVQIAVVSPTNQLLQRADVSLAAPFQQFAKNATDGSNFLSVFRSETATTDRILAQRLGPDGVALDAEPIVIADTATAPSGFDVVFINGRFVALFDGTFNGSPQIYAQQVSTAGQLIGAPIALTNEFGLDNASVNGNRLIVVGNQTFGHFSVRYGRIFDESLAPVTAKFQVGGNFALFGDTEPVSGGWLAVWTGKPSHDFQRRFLHYNVIHLDGTTTGEAGIADAYPDNGTPTIGSAGPNATNAIVVYQQFRDAANPQINDFDALRGTIVSADGTVGPTRTLIDVPETQEQPNATFDGEEYVITWVDRRNYPYPTQGRDDVFAARVALDGTTIDEGGFPVADTFRNEANASVIANASGNVVFVYQTFRHEQPYASYRLGTRATTSGLSTRPPAMVGAPIFEMSNDQAVSFAFDRPLTNVDPSDIVMTNITTGQTVTSFTTQSITSGNQPWQYRWIFTGGGVLPDGNYRVTLPAGSVTDLNGVPTDRDYVAEFFFLQGDVNRDRHVDESDRATQAAHVGQSGRFGDGDLNYDGTINAADAAILNTAMKMWLPSQGTLNLPTTSGADVYRVSLEAGNGGLLEVFTASDTNATYRIPLGAIEALNFDGGSGADSLAIDFSSGVIAKPITFDGGAGRNALAIIGTPATDHVVFGDGIVSFGSVPTTVTHSDASRVSYEATGNDNLVVNEHATVTLTGAPRLSAIAINDFGGIELPNGASQTLVVDTLAIAKNGRLDLNDNDAQVTATAYANVAAAIADGRIVSSTAANSPVGNTALALLSGEEYSVNNGSPTFNGLSVHPTDALIKYTYFGDVDFNGSVDASDYNLIDFGFANHLSGWANGDADWSGGSTDVSDYNLIDYAFTTQSGAL